MSLATEFELLGRILIAGLCGALIGFERKNRKKEAGIRTHIIVALASSLMMIISKYGFFDIISGNLFPGIDVRLDPSRIASCIVSGIGFLGAGMIFTYKKTITGLTTAAGIWATAGVGMIPRSTTSPHALIIPLARAQKSISPEILVSIPTTNTGISPSSFSTLHAAAPSSNAIFGVRSLFAIPLTPSVPNNLAINLPYFSFVFIFVTVNKSTTAEA